MKDRLSNAKSVVPFPYESLWSRPVGEKAHAAIGARNRANTMGTAIEGPR